MTDFKKAQHVERMLVELSELTERKQKLEAFIGTDNYNALSSTKQSLLVIQLSSMTTYAAVLTARLNMEGE
jgi:GTP cyclohydrolase III